MEGVIGQPGPKRLQLVFLRDTRSEDLARKFMADFRAVSSPSEWSALINEMVQLGDMLSNSAKKGDVLAVDWIPDTGLIVTKNGSPLSPKPIASELMFRIIMRIFLGPLAQEAARESLLGRKPWNE